MARITIEMPETYCYQTEFTIRITDINYGNHVGNDAFVSLIHEARVRFLKQYHYSEENIEGLVLLIADLAVTYQSQCFYGDKLMCEIGINEFNKYGCDMYYRVTHKKTGQTVVHAKTGIVFFDLNLQKISPVPNAFKLKFT